ncbi:UDP-glucose 4-epimerase GalE [Chromobacterium alticapitis]|uniref:UDP-glucose 4-epimerase n=1 Tax=Chromobacterium alticapitis TaxID=2073169 RepID=A0A2S5DDR2_9NEIS|nr:UDP-glucose 4-epimerase GalE [Chromobacterium alticapitis]POZ61226.1 UDP-glucose 4-epimerase GalE [Chromobacterium alticapitis]
MILVTGGAGYIGSHACVELLTAGHELVVLDNLRHGKAEALRRVQALTGKALSFIHGDIRDEAALEAAFRYPIDAVIHFAGLKVVGDSVVKPLEYYENNVGGTLALLGAMRRHGVKRLVFSSSANIYGNPGRMPIAEDTPLSPGSPYGRSKLMAEEMLRDLAWADPEWRIAVLRYFNPVGAHESGEIGEDPEGAPNNLLPFITQVACGKQAFLNVFGGDYATHDGTGVRDYIHVADLAEGHLKALEVLEQRLGLTTANLGTGRGYSVLEMVKAFERVNGVAVPYQMAARRVGDIAESWADVSAARTQLGWTARKGLDDMCRDSWRWQCRNPAGFS